MRYLLDTNILAEPLRPMPRAETLAQIQRPQSQIAIPALVSFNRDDFVRFQGLQLESW